MSTTERVSLILGAVVSLVTLVGSVSYAAISFNNLSMAIDRYSSEMEWVRESIADKNRVHDEYEDRLDAHDRLLAKFERGFIEKVYVNHEFSIFKYVEDGREKLIKVPTTRMLEQG